MLLENCYIKGISLPLISGNSESDPGWINAVDSLYYIGTENKTSQLKPQNNNSDKYLTNKNLTEKPDPLVTDAPEFRSALPYSDYIKYDASKLNDDIVPLTGAGNLSMSEAQWEKTSYGKRDTTTNPGESEDDDTPDGEMVVKFSLNANDLSDETITSNKPIGKFTIKATTTDSKTVVVGSDDKTIEDKSFTKSIQLGGSGAANYRSIHFTANEPGTLTVYARSGGSDSRNLGLYKYNNSTGTLVDEAKPVSGSGSKVTYKITEAGDYYIQSESKGINIYYIAFAVKKTEGNDTDESANTPDSTEDESTQSPSSTEDEGTQTSSTPEGTQTDESSSEETSGSETSSTGESMSEEFSSSEESDTLIEFSLRMDEIKVDGEEVPKISSDHTQNGFTIKASSTSEVEVSSSSATVGGVRYEKRLRLNGTPSKDSYSIHFTTKDAGTLWVYAKNASSSGSKILALNKLDGNSAVVKQREQLDKETAAVRYDITEAGNYYIAPETKGIDVYYIAFTNRKEVEPEYTKPQRPKGDIVYNANAGADNTKTMYNMEGYAATANVTGGGLLKEESPHYYKVSNEKEFLDALKAIQAVTDTPNVIEITADLNLGNIELNKKYEAEGFNITSKSTGNYSGVIRAYDKDTSQYPIMHPTLKETGVSWLKMHNFHNLTIFSQNGASIKHAGIGFEGGSSNIIIRNIVFDELWEWDESTKGDYDRNDWDYMTIENNATDIWVDHCTFYRSYDGILDMKNDSKYKDLQRVTVSWCEVLPGSKGNTFFNEQMDWLEEHIDETTYYKQLRQTEGMSKENVWWYACGQKKAHLLGSGNGDIQDKAIRATFANIYWKNVQARLPRLRFGKAHIYNSVIDSAEMNEQYRAGNSHITGDGAISTLNGEMLLENCYIDGARNPIRSGRGSVTGYVNFDNCLYYMNGSPAALTITEDSAGLKKITDIEAFRENLPYEYDKYEPETLKDRLTSYAGAGKLNMTAVQWERTSYNGEEGGDVSGTGTEEGSSTEASESDIRIVGLEDSYPYTGDKITPAFDVYDYNAPVEKQLLAPGIDYTVTYQNNVKPTDESGKPAKIIVKGKGNYAATKTAEATFEIKKKTDVTAFADIKGAKIDKIEDQSYTGEPYNPPEIKLTWKGKEAKTVTYVYDGETKAYKKKQENGSLTALDVYIAVSNNVNKGNASVLVSGVDSKGKTVNLKTKFKILALNLDDGKTTIEPEPEAKKLVADYLPNGAVPKFTVKYDGKTLQPGRDYTVKYSNNKKVQEKPAVLTVTGKGNYAKKVTKDYEIKQADMSNFQVKAVTAYNGIKVKQIKATVEDGNGNVLKANQYKLEVYAVKGGDSPGAQYGDKDILETGEIFVKAVAADLTNLKERSATQPEKFKVGIDISKANFPLAPDYKKGILYTGKEITLEEKHFDKDNVTIKVKKDGVTTKEKLKMGRDYEIVSYVNNVNKGTATAVIKGIGAYSGTKTIKFKIKQQPIADIKRQLIDALEQISGAIVPT
ncbi:MAG: hypothetical protein K2N89_09060 [Lachnospiraceae bacterium]|nr:hypothetical protein [Lachnospiraceae bacterium]